MGDKSVSGTGDSSCDIHAGNKQNGYKKQGTHAVEMQLSLKRALLSILIATGIQFQLLDYFIQSSRRITALVHYQLIGHTRIPPSRLFQCAPILSTNLSVDKQEVFYLSFDFRIRC